MVTCASSLVSYPFLRVSDKKRNIFNLKSKSKKLVGHDTPTVPSGGRFPLGKSCNLTLFKVWSRTWLSICRSRKAGTLAGHTIWGNDRKTENPSLNVVNITSEIWNINQETETLYRSWQTEPEGWTLRTLSELGISQASLLASLMMRQVFARQVPHLLTHAKIRSVCNVHTSLENTTQGGCLMLR